MFNKTFLARILPGSIFALALIPFYANAAIVSCGGPGDACNFCDLFTLVDRIVNFFVKDLAFPLAIVGLLYGGVMWITAGGDPGKIDKGRKAIEYAVYGVIIVFAAWLIVDTVLKALLDGGVGNIKGWGPWNKIPTCG